MTSTGLGAALGIAPTAAPLKAVPTVSRRSGAHWDYFDSDPEWTPEQREEELTAWKESAVKGHRLTRLNKDFHD